MGSEQRIAAELGYSETVFVYDRAEARLRIFTPAVELPLAGHPLVGTSWLLDRTGAAPTVLRPPAGEVPTWQDADLTWIRARPEDAPDFDLVELDAAAEVEALAASPDGGGKTIAWAWIDEPAGLMRTRAFLPDFGIQEDEATGSAALRLCALVGRPSRSSRARHRCFTPAPLRTAGRCRRPGGARLALLLLARRLGREFLPLGSGHLADDKVTAVDLLLHLLQLGLALLILAFLGVFTPTVSPARRTTMPSRRTARGHRPGAAPRVPRRPRTGETTASRRDRCRTRPSAH